MQVTSRTASWDSLHARRGGAQRTSEGLGCQRSEAIRIVRLFVVFSLSNRKGPRGPTHVLGRQQEKPRCLSLELLTTGCRAASRELWCTVQEPWIPVGLKEPRPTTIPSDGCWGGPEALNVSYVRRGVCFRLRSLGSGARAPKKARRNPGRPFLWPS